MWTVLVDWDVCGAIARLTRRYMGRLHSWPKLRFLKLMKRVKWRGITEARKVMPQSVFRLGSSIENSYSCCHTIYHLITNVWPYREAANNVWLYSHI